MTAETITPDKEIIGLSNFVIRKMLSVKIIKPIIPLMTMDWSLIEISESIIDITEDFNENIKVKQLELDEYIKVLQNYKASLTEISTKLTKKIDQHSQKIKEGMTLFFLSINYWFYNFFIYFL